MRRMILFVSMLSAAVCMAGTKAPLDFSDPMGVARDVPFAAHAGAFPRDGGHHPAYYTPEYIRDLRSDPEAVAKARATADKELLMQLSAEQIRSIPKPYAGFEMTRCPHCKRLYQYGIHLWEWHHDDPDHITCTNCQTSLPNEQYPEDRTVSIVGPDGTAVAYPYYQDEEGVRYFYCSKIQQIAQREIALNRILNVVEGCVATGDREYACQLAVLLAHLAEVYRVLPFHGPGGGYGEAATGYVEKFYDPNPPHEYMSGKWYNTAYSELFYTRKLAIAYDMIYHSGALKEISSELGYDVREPIERDLLYAAAERTLELPRILDNYDPQAIGGIAVVGRTLNDPMLIRGGLEWLEKLLQNTVMRDGMWYEGNFNYHASVGSGLVRAANALQGYSDPVDYRGDDRLDDLDVYARYPVLKTFWLSGFDLHWPNGQLVLLADTTYRYGVTMNDWDHFYEQVRKGYPDFADASRPYETIEEFCRLDREPSALKESIGIALMRCGDAENRAQLNVVFGYPAGHHHFDKLSIGLYALGDEMLSERGYTYTSMRPFATGTSSHNGVVIDGSSQTYTVGGDVRCLILNLGGQEDGSPVQFCQVDGRNIYPVTASGRYERSAALVSVDEQAAYVVDVFHVAGGSMHDYFLHGSCDNEMTAVSSVEMTPAEGTLQDITSFTPPDRYSSMHYMELIETGASSSGQVDITFKYKDPCRRDSRLQAYVRMDSPVDIINTQASTIRKAKEEDKNLPLSMTAGLCLRSQSPRTIFAVVMAPSRGEALIESVRRLDIAADKNVVGFRIVMDEYVDIVLIGSEGAAAVTLRPRIAGIHHQIRFQGTLGFLRFARESSGLGQLKSVVAAQASVFQVDDRCLSSPAELTGAITAVSSSILRDGPSFFETAATLPAYDSLRNQIVLARRPDGVADVYVVDHVDAIKAGSRVYLRPGSTMIESQDVVYAVDSEQRIIETPVPLKRAICSQWEKGRRLRVTGHTFTIEKVLNTLRPATFETPTRIVVDMPQGLEDVSVGDKVEILSNVPGDTWMISRALVQTY